MAKKRKKKSKIIAKFTGDPAIKKLMAAARELLPPGVTEAELLEIMMGEEGEEADLDALFEDDLEPLPSDPRAAKPILEQAYKKQEAKLDPKLFDEGVGHFWGIRETRPYMSARAELAECQLALGEFDAAAEHFQELLRLNPNDNQGLRNRLLLVYFKINRLDDVEELLEQYEPEPTAAWLFGRVLLEFRRNGDSPATREFLQNAQQQNPHVASFMVGAKPLPNSMPASYCLGEESEAVFTATDYLTVWRETPGALPWLKKQAQFEQPEPPKMWKPINWKRAKSILANLEQDESVWEIDLIQMKDVPETDPFWALAIVDRDEGVPYFLETWEDRPDDKEVWKCLIETMYNPEAMEPHRPEKILLTRKVLVKKWSSKLGQIDIACELTEELPGIAAFVDSFIAKSEARFSKLTEPVPVEELETLPLEFGEIWFVIQRPLPSWVQIAGEFTRPQLLLVMNASEGTVVATEIRDEAPTDEWIKLGIEGALVTPLAGEPRRPSEMIFFEQHVWKLLENHLDRIGIQTSFREDDSEIVPMLNSLMTHVVGPRRSFPICRTAGVTLESQAEFYRLAAEFYRRAIWNKVPVEHIIRIESDDYSSGPWYLVLMGQNGQELGFVLYEDFELLKKIFLSPTSPEKYMNEMSMLAIDFGEQFNMPPEDFDEIQKHGWELENEEAYPAFTRINPGMTFRAALAWEVELVKACLSVLPEFVVERKCADSELTAKLDSRDVTLRLSEVDQNSF